MATEIIAISDFIIDTTPDYSLLENIENIQNNTNILSENNASYFRNVDSELENLNQLNEINIPYDNVNSVELPMDIDEINNNSQNYNINNIQYLRENEYSNENKDEYNNLYNFSNINRNLNFTSQYYYLNTFNEYDEFINIIPIHERTQNESPTIIINLSEINTLDDERKENDEQENSKHNILVYYFHNSLLNIRENECCICMDEKQTNMCKLNCSHEFCVDCISQLLDKCLNENKQPTCPLCREKIDEIYTQKLENMDKLNIYCHFITSFNQL